jgi:hypothetical protein
LVPHDQRVLKVQNILENSKDSKRIKLRLKRSTKQNKDRICLKNSYYYESTKAPVKKFNK